MSEISIPGLPERRADAHKGDAGRVLVIAGSRGMTGAAVLATNAALRAGAGLVKLDVPESVWEVTVSTTVCALTSPVPDEKTAGFCSLSAEHLLKDASWADVVALGPGIGRASETGQCVRTILPQIDKPLVIDADGLFHLADSLELLQERPEPTILTPHPGEMAHLIGSDVDTVQFGRRDVAIEFAAKHNVVCVLKGAGTVVTDGSRCYVNCSGNSGMATGGTGDVLTGLIAGLSAQGMTAFDAAVLGVYLHGVAGDGAARKFGIHSMLATDVLDCLPGAFLSHSSG